MTIIVRQRNQKYLELPTPAACTVILTMSLITIAEEVRTRFPNQYTAVFGPFSVRQEDINPGIIDTLRQKCVEAQGAWKQAPPVGILHWRELFRQMGARSGTRASVDALFRRYMRDGGLPTIDPLVDLYNWLSLAHAIPMAAYDADFLGPVLELRRGAAGEPFEPLGAPSVAEPVAEGEIVYADAKGVVCRYWNWRDCHRTRIRPDTRTAIFVADITADDSGDASYTADVIATVLTAALRSPLRTSITPFI